MKRVANNRRYYELLHQLEDLDPKWSEHIGKEGKLNNCLLYTSPSPRD